MLSFDDKKETSKKFPEKRSAPYSPAAGISFRAQGPAAQLLALPSAAKAVAYMGGIKPVVQRFANITTLTHVNPEITLKMDYFGTRPPIIYESMSTNINDAENIFTQTKLYPGNTICVVGMNRRRPDDIPPDMPHPPAIENLADRDERVGGYVHSLKGFKFMWRKPHDVDENEQYKMPFIEARLTVMKEAKATVESVKENIPQKPNKNPLSTPMSSPLFRWIDGDARDDSTYKMSTSILNRLANPANTQVNVISGSYGWRSEHDLTNCPSYKQLLDKINDAEKQIRDKYFSYSAKSAEDNSAEPTSNISLANFMPLPSYYLPESTLLMSEDTHNIMLGGGQMFTIISSLYKVCRQRQENRANRAVGLTLEQAQAEFARIGTEGIPNDLAELVRAVSNNATDAGIIALKERIETIYGDYMNKFDYQASQDKESMRLLTLANEHVGIIKRNNFDWLSEVEARAKENQFNLLSSVYHSDKLTVTKPLKHEFDESRGDAPNYLGADFLALLRRGEQVPFERFVVLLNQMRQNVFQRFNMHVPDFIALKERLLHEIYDLYLRLANDIGNELRVLPPRL